MAVIAVAVSGGVDSLYALVTLQDQGHQVMALHGRFLNQHGPDPVPGLQDICAKLGIPLYVPDMRAAFDAAVLEPFVRAYADGRTPNPCALCNARIKFGALLDAARALGAERLATGHYAGFIDHALYGPALRQGADAGKDQSYFLSLVPWERLCQALFPLADTAKTDAVASLAQRGLPVPLPGESQEICFVPHDDYRAFMAQQSRDRGIPLSPPGPMLLSNGRQVGQHQGLWQYTEGQRRGLGVAWSEPLYVTGKDRRRNALLLGPRTELGMTFCRTGQANLLVAPEYWPEALFVRVRYRQRNLPATVHLDKGQLYITLGTPQMPSAPGQSAVVYDGDGVVLAGGVIEEQQIG